MLLPRANVLMKNNETKPDSTPQVKSPQSTFFLADDGMNTSTTNPDVEKQPRRRSGYPSLAAWIARDPDNETYVFRKFDRLSATNLLNLQNELIALEADIDSADEEMRLAGESNPVMKRTMLSWEAWKRNAQHLTSLEKRKKALETNLRDKIKEYRMPTPFLGL